MGRGRKIRFYITKWRVVNLWFVYILRNEKLKKEEETLWGSIYL